MNDEYISDNTSTRGTKRVRVMTPTEERHHERRKLTFRERLARLQSPEVPPGLAQPMSVFGQATKHDEPRAQVRRPPPQVENPQPLSLSSPTPSDLLAEERRARLERFRRRNLQLGRPPPAYAVPRSIPSVTLGAPPPPNTLPSTELSAQAFKPDPVVSLPPPPQFVPSPLQSTPTPSIPEGAQSSSSAAAIIDLCRDSPTPLQPAPSPSIPEHAQGSSSAPDVMDLCSDSDESEAEGAAPNPTTRAEELKAKYIMQEKRSAFHTEAQLLPRQPHRPWARGNSAANWICKPEQRHIDHGLRDAEIPDAFDESFPRYAVCPQEMKYFHSFLEARYRFNDLRDYQHLLGLFLNTQAVEAVKSGQRYSELAELGQMVHQLLVDLDASEEE